VVSSEELLPPDFQRYCAAVATWGPNLGCISMMVTISLQAMHRPDMLGSASHLLSWDTGEAYPACCLMYFVTGIKYSYNEECLTWRMNEAMACATLV
jgi:hypothetical protein